MSAEIKTRFSNYLLKLEEFPTGNIHLETDMKK